MISGIALSLVTVARNLGATWYSLTSPYTQLLNLLDFTSSAPFHRASPSPSPKHMKRSPTGPPLVSPPCAPAGPATCGGIRHDDDVNSVPMKYKTVTAWPCPCQGRMSPALCDILQCCPVRSFIGERGVDMSLCTVILCAMVPSRTDSLTVLEKLFLEEILKNP